MGVASVFAVLGAGLSMGFGAIGSAVGEGIIAMKAVEALGRQPRASAKILRIMIVSQAVTETAAIFALVVSLVLIFQSGGDSVFKGVTFLSAGFCMGMGAIGTGFGVGLPGAGAMEGIGRQPKNSDALTVNMIVGQAVTEVSGIFALTISLILIMLPPAEGFVKMSACMAAGICMGFGALGPGIGDGIVARFANLAIARDVKNAALITRSMIVGQAITETTAIYAVVVSLILIFVV
jgi:F-type H+-transporting ATPase subunit c